MKTKECKECGNGLFNYKNRMTEGENIFELTKIRGNKGV